jgi:hypothetical protein
MTISGLRMSWRELAKCRIGWPTSWHACKDTIFFADHTVCIDFPGKQFLIQR